MPGLMGAEEALRMAKEEFMARVEPPARNSSNTSLLSLPATLGDMSIRRSSSRLLNIFSKKSPNSTTVNECSLVVNCSIILIYSAATPLSSTSSGSASSHKVGYNQLCNIMTRNFHFETKCPAGKWLAQQCCWKNGYRNLQPLPRWNWAGFKAFPNVTHSPSQEHSVLHQQELLLARWWYDSPTP